ncbi:class I adenylate-forming enzyme family protein [Alloalcanivorax mobilis]|uniref:class I adenylate-forming enzyme family protein n=1 Tax=Alloalcanivorax mobilis TaxID=2019569 RepID=UPI000C75D54D|nr:AMP-binding protein [Alloalcanivorax mobilis]
MNIANWLHDQALCHPRRPALFQGATPVADYHGFAARAVAIATWLGERHGIAPGDRVAVFMKNSIDYLPVLYGIWWAGAVAVPVNAKLHAAEAAWIVNNAESRLVVTEDGRTLADHEHKQGAEIAVADLPAAGDNAIVPPCSRHQDDLAWLFYTSGTTGRSKGVMLTHGNLVAMSLCYAVDVDTVSSDDAALYAAPMSHGAGLYNFIHVRCGARHVLPGSRGFDAAEVLDLAKHLGRVSMFAAPTMVKRLVAEARHRGEHGEGLKSIIYGGAPMYNADIREALDILGPRFIQVYGQGESPMTITALERGRISDHDAPGWARQLASVGRAQSCVDVRVVDDHMHPLPAGEPGEVAVRGQAVMAGYWRNPEATEKTLIDGWLRTGDIGFIDEEGFLTLTDRSKDVIISGGSNIYPREIEEVLSLHPAVREVSVVGQRDPEWGEIVVAFVVADDVDAETLTRWFTDHMASFKKPKKYYFCDELPKNNYGKILKTELRNRLEALA